jgi:hypothetical protein
MLAAAATVLTGCGSSPAPGARTLSLETLNGSGVTGTVTFSPVDEATTLVVVEVDPAGHANMPAHIHPGTCAELTPQPRHPLQNVIGGRSVTEVPAGMRDLFQATVALNLHASNEDMQTYTACVDLR